MLLLLAGAIICSSPWLLLFAWLAALAALVRCGFGLFHGRTVVAFVVPLGVSAILIQGLLQPVSVPWWHRFVDVAAPAAAMSFRVALIAAVMQLSVLPILNDGRFVDFLRWWRIPVRAQLVMVGGVTLVAEVNLRARQLLEANLARGRGAVTRWGTVSQVPFVLMPLFVYMFDAALKRADFWDERRIVMKLARFQSPAAAGAMTAEAVAWAMISIVWVMLAWQSHN